jgi:hypothetical protein
MKHDDLDVNVAQQVRLTKVSFAKRERARTRSRSLCGIDGAIPNCHEGYNFYDLLVVTGPEREHVSANGRASDEGRSPGERQAPEGSRSPRGTIHGSSKRSRRAGCAETRARRSERQAAPLTAVLRLSK